MLKLITEQGPVEDETTSEIEYIVDTLAWQHPSLVAAAGHPVPEQTALFTGPSAISVRRHNSDQTTTNQALLNARERFNV